MVLEVIEQNTAAVELYRACGFQTIRRLIGFAGPAAVSDAVASAGLVEVDLRDVAAAVTRHGLTDLPWQLSGETLAQLTPPNVAYRLDDAWIALTDPAQSVVTIRGLIAEPTIGDGTPPCRDREAALLRAVMAKHPGREEWRFSAVWPEELASVIAPAGLPRSPLTQWQMQRKI
jgi:hypothetical protein